MNTWFTTHKQRMFPLILLQAKAVSLTFDLEYDQLPTVSINSPSGEGGETILNSGHKILGICDVSINSPSGEGGELGFVMK